MIKSKILIILLLITSPYSLITKDNSQNWYANLLNTATSKIDKSLREFDSKLLYKTMTNISNNNFSQVYENSSYLFKEQIPKQDFISQVNFLQSVNGKLQSYNLNSAFISDSVTVFIFDSKFSKIKTQASIQLIYVMSWQNKLKLAGFNLQNENYQVIKKIDEIGQPFIKDFLDGEFIKIYDESSDIYKDNVSIEQFAKMHDSIKALGKINSIKYYNYTFGVEADGEIISIIYILDIANKEYKMTLSYIIEDGKYKLMRVQS